MTFRHLGALPYSIIAKGLIVGSSLVAGAFIAKGMVLRIAPEKFALMMDGLLLMAGLTLAWSALR